MELIFSLGVIVLVMVFAAWQVSVVHQQSERYREDCLELGKFGRRATAATSPAAYAALAAADRGELAAPVATSAESPKKPEEIQGRRPTMPIPESLMSAIELAQAEAENQFLSPEITKE